MFTFTTTLFLSLLAFSPLSILAQTITTSSYPTLVYPIEDQFPPLAHVGNPFNFTLLQGTFASDLGNTLSYDVTGLPKWVVFNEESLLFAGVPTSFDEGRSRVKVVAMDGEFNKTSVFTLLVVSTSPPLLLTPVSTQLNNTVSISSAIRLPSARGVLVHPYYSFSLGFVLSTVLSTSGAKIHYGALTTTSTSLPSWLTFDNTTATFYGVAPGTGSWDVVMVGSEMEGFGDIRETLNIEVGIHALDLVEDLGEVRGIAGSAIVNGSVATRGLRLDGLNVTREEVSAVVVLTGYEWLSFDESDFTLQGTPPSSFINGTSIPIELPITFTSISTNVSIASTLPLSIVPFPFTTFVTPNLTATANSSFTTSISQYLVNRTTTLSATFSPTEVGDWLKFDTSSGELSGTVPGSTSYDQAEVQVTATDPSTGLAGILSLGVVVQGAVHVPSTASSSSTASASSSAGAVVGGSSGLSTAAKIAIGATLGGLFLIGLLVLLVLCCCIRRRRNRSRIAAAAAYQHEKKPPGEEEDGEMANIDLGAGNDPFNNGRHLSTSSRNNPYGLDSPSKIKKPFLGAIPPFSALNLPGTTTPTGAPKSPTKKDRPRRLDLMRGMFGSSRAAHADVAEDEDSVSTGNHQQQLNESKLQKDLSGISRTLPRSDSDASFFSGMSAGGDQISAEDVDGNDPVPFGVRLVGGAAGAGFPRPSRETGTTRGREGSISSSPTFSSVGGDGESRASWESERSFRWNSERDVAAGAAAAGLAVGAGADSNPRPRNGFVNRHTPTSAVFPAAQLERDQTVNSIAASSAFADASTPGQSRHQLATLAAGARASESQSDGFSNSQDSTSFGGSVTSPLSRFGDPSSHPTGFPTLDEETRNANESFSSSHSSDNHSDLLHASTSHPYSFHQDANEVGLASSAQLLAPPATPPNPTSPTSSSRPRPRLIPSRERIPTISHLSPRPSTSTREEELEDGDESFVDADEDEEEDEERRRRTGQSFDYVRGGEDLEGLGYPASSAIYYSSPPTEPFNPPTHQPSSNNSPPPNPSIRQVGGPPPPPPHSPAIGTIRPVSNESSVSEDPFAQYHRFSDPMSSSTHGQ